MIKAECHSDDFRMEASFDATRWFEQASDQEITALAECGWRGDYPADEVARHFEDDATRDVFEYLAVKPKMPNGDPVGFECSVSEEDALAWLRVNRPDLAARIENELGDFPRP